MVEEFDGERIKEICSEWGRGVGDGVGGRRELGLCATYGRYRSGDER
jgi:hypothetical protein